MNCFFKSLKFLLLLGLVLFIGSLLLFGHKDIPVEELKRKYTNEASSFLAIDDMEVHYRDEGPKNDDVPIVLIHGTASSLHTFDAWTAQLKKTQRVIRMDLPGFGLTGPFPDGNYSMSHYSEFLNQFLTALGIKSCIIGGNSLGGEIAWNFTVDHPDMVEKLILIDAAGFHLDPKSIPIGFKVAQIPILKNLFTYVTPRFLVKSSVENVFFDKSKVHPALVDRYYDLTLREGNRQAFVDRINTKDNDHSENLKKIKQPTLIIWGSDDLLIPLDYAYKFQNYLPNSRLSVIEHSGHTPMEEHPMQSLKPVYDFLKN